MRVLRIIASVDPAQGGPVEALRHSAKAQAALGIETDVLCLDEQTSPHALCFPARVFGLGPVQHRYGYTPRLGMWMRQHAAAYDAAVIHGLWNHASVAGGQAAIRAGLPHLVFTHGMLDPWFRAAYPAKHALKQAFWATYQGRVLARAHKVLFTSGEEQRLAEGMFRMWPYRGHVVPYGAAQPGSRDRKEGPAAFRAACPGLGSAPFVLFLSRLHRKKGADLLVDAFAEIAARRPDLHLVVAGPDQEGIAKTLATTAAAVGLGGRVHLPGPLLGCAKWGALLSAEALALPSHGENFGIILAEAMACGTPVLTTKRVNIWREIEAGGAGLVTENDHAGTVEGLARFLALAPAAVDGMRRQARRTYERHFSVSCAAEALAELLQEAAHARRA
ncbi:glycosyltransferase [Roseicyclus sp. F158]|uniref:Glycosyltransferase n=1 Tax=Tropicimonas omnivorans TaxID=3075590 RepID=A0ABU3DFI0_9RHOB|nr:glycosyltransferase [Roseicyclus sp. F158]MDT0682473.1 glycosyltransferase [Roseicyclus sp. F158]